MENGFTRPELAQIEKQIDEIIARADGVAGPRDDDEATLDDLVQALTRSYKLARRNEIGLRAV